MSSLRPLLGAMALLLVLGLGNLGCELDEVDPKIRDDSTFPTTLHMRSIGNSLTAGFQGGGLEQTGQHASFPNLMSQIITGRAMKMPLIAAPGIGSESGMSPLFVNANGDLTREPLTQPPTDLALNLTYPLPYDNMGVPGATTSQLLTAMSGADANGNSFFDLILRNSVTPPFTGTCMAQLEFVAPDIVTAWSGNNEILGGALSGSPQSDDPGAPGYIVPLAQFQPDFIEFCDRIEALEPEMVAVGNVPPITSIPYVRFIGTGPPFNPFARWNMAEDLDGDDDNVELVLLPIAAIVGACAECYLYPACETAASCDTIPANATLTTAEVALINDTIDDYNTFIAAEVATRGWAMVDVNAAFLELPLSPSPDEPNAAFPWLVDPLTGIGVKNEQSTFTLDGVHPSEKGHGVLANAFLEALNTLYGTDYPFVDVDPIVNVAGFEEAPIATKLESGVRITEEGRRGLESMVEMMSIRSTYQ